MNSELKFNLNGLDFNLNKLELDVKVSSEAVNKEKRTMIPIRKDYRVTIETTDVNTTVIISKYNTRISRDFTIVNKGLTKTADAQVTFQYETVTYRRIELKNNLNCQSFDNKITCKLNELDYEKFHLMEIYNEEEGKLGIFL